MSGDEIRVPSYMNMILIAYHIYTDTDVKLVGVGDECSVVNRLV